jgi:hypothetical protein
MKKARTLDNMVYLLSANHGVYISEGADEFSPPDRSRGKSAVFSYDGNHTAVIDAPGEAVLHGSVDLERLRGYRGAAVNSKLAQLRAQLVAPEYARFPGWPNDAWADKPIGLASETRALVDSVIAKQKEQGLIVGAEE